jgi:hypothetical protein
LQLYKKYFEVLIFIIVNIRLSILSLLIALISLSCVENVISIRIHPDGQSAFKFYSYGDSLDIFDDDFIHPLTTINQQPRRILDNDDGNWEQTTEMVLEDSIYVFRTEDSLSLGYKYWKDISVSFFKTEYDFKLTFSGRMIKTDYPKLYSAIKSENLDSINWAPEAFIVLMKKGLNDLAQKSISESNIIFNDRLVNHVRNSFQKIDSEEILDRIKNDKTKILSELLQPFKLKKDLPILLSDAMHPHERKLRNTIGLFNDRFTVKMLMPGQPFITNATEINKDTLVWDFGIDSLLHNDYEIKAKSIVYEFERLQKLILGITIFLLFIFIIMRIALK